MVFFSCCYFHFPARPHLALSARAALGPAVDYHRARGRGYPQPERIQGTYFGYPGRDVGPGGGLDEHGVVLANGKDVGETQEVLALPAEPVPMLGNGAEPAFSTELGEASGQGASHSA